MWVGGRFYDPTAGEVSLDGRPLRQLDLTWLRRQATPPPSALSVARQATPPVSPVALKMGGVTRMAGGVSLALRVSEFKLVEFRVCHHAPRTRLGEGEGLVVDGPAAGVRLDARLDIYIT